MDPLIRAVLDALGRLLQAFPSPLRLLLAYSGGRDSSVLLHVLASARTALPAPLHAVHVDHGLQPQSPAWTQTCRDFSTGLGVPFTCLKAQGEPQRGESREAWARTARYRALGDFVAAGDVVLTAHHQQDNAETFLLNALRGSGPEGLRGIAPARMSGSVPLLRPMLEIPAERIGRYADRHHLEFIEDPMNHDRDLARARLRHEIMPALERYWPGAPAVFARNARWQREAAEVLAEAARKLLGEDPSHMECLPLGVLAQATPALTAHLIRAWLKARGVRAPVAARLAEFQRQCQTAGADRHPTLRWEGLALHRWRGALHLAADLPRRPFDLAWDPSTGALETPAGRLEGFRHRGVGAVRQPSPEGYRVTTRRGGERCRLPGRNRHTSLKQVLQELQIPPWEREGLPLVWRGGELAAVADRLICADQSASPSTEGWIFEWRARALPDVVSSPPPESGKATDA